MSSACWRSQGFTSTCACSACAEGSFFWVVEARRMGLSPSVPCWAASIASPMRSCILSWTATGAQGEPNTHGGSSRRRAKEKEGWAGYRHFASFPFFPLAFNELGGVLTCCLCWGAKTPYHPAFFLSAALSDGPPERSHLFPAQQQAGRPPRPLWPRQPPKSKGSRIRCRMQSPPTG